MTRYVTNENKLLKLINNQNNCNHHNIGLRGGGSGNDILNKYKVKTTPTQIKKNVTE
jgi:hypothetical protein